MKHVLVFKISALKPVFQNHQEQESQPLSFVVSVFIGKGKEKVNEANVVQNITVRENGELVVFFFLLVVLFPLCLKVLLFQINMLESSFTSTRFFFSSARTIRLSFLLSIFFSPPCLLVCF